MDGAMHRKRVCFFARVKDKNLLSRIGFYAQDLAMLSDLGLDISIATRASEIRRADLYFVWWWTYAFLPLLHPARIGKPVVITGTFDLWSYADRPRYQRAALQFALRSASLNAFNSLLECEAVPRAITTRHPVYVGTGIDTGTFQPNGPRDPYLIVTLASMTGANAVRKSIPEILKAIPAIKAAHPNVRFVLAGECDASFRREIVDQGMASYVSLPGVIDHATKLALMQQCAVYLQPTRYEGFGVAIAEALSCAAPVVTSAVGQVPTVVGDTAVYVDGTNVEQIAAATIRLLTDRGAAEQRGKAGRARIEREFSLPVHRRRWEGLINGLLYPEAQERAL